MQENATWCFCKHHEHVFLNTYRYLYLLLFSSWYWSDTDIQKTQPMYGFSDNRPDYRCNTSPIHKKGSHTEPSNYLPISLTSVCSKVMEHIIYHTIIEHLNSNNILINNQHGFRSQHFCVTQLIDLVEDLSFAMDHQRQVDVILLDFSKAFDSVPHQRLLKKLKHYGISNNIYKWIETWFTRRSQCVVLFPRIRFQFNLVFHREL